MYKMLKHPRHQNNLRIYVMKSGYEQLIWVKDKRGKEYVCSLDDLAINKSFEQLSQEEKMRCSDVNQIVGTERW